MLAGTPQMNPASHLKCVCTHSARNSMLKPNAIKDIRLNQLLHLSPKINFSNMWALVVGQLFHLYSGCHL